MLYCSHYADHFTGFVRKNNTSVVKIYHMIQKKKKFGIDYKVLFETSKKKKVAINLLASKFILSAHILPYQRFLSILQFL